MLKNDILKKVLQEVSMKKGFTLIELLVVVLIIGILSAVALPQYTRSVKRSRAATITPILKSLSEAGQLYLLQYPTTTTSFPLEELNIELSSTTFDLKEDGDCTFSVGKSSGNLFKTIARCEGSNLLFGLTNTGLLFCAGNKATTLCKDYGFSKASTLTAGGSFGGSITGSVYTM